MQTTQNHWTHNTALPHTTKSPSVGLFALGYYNLLITPRLLDLGLRTSAIPWPHSTLWPNPSLHTMFVIPLKSSPSKDIKTPLNSWLSNEISPSTATSFTADFSKLQSLRNAASSVTTHTHANASTILNDYHVALNSLESAGFPTTDGDAYNLQITWSCAFETHKKITRGNVRYERASTLFNYAALDSHLAATADRTTELGLKTACNKFQQSAGTFHYLHSLTTPPSSIDSNPTIDLLPTTLKMCSNLMLAQAQACVYEKAVSKKGNDRTKPSILAKISMAASELYDEALRGCEDPELRRKIDSTWAVNLKQQKLCFLAASNWWESVNLSETAAATGSGYGMEIARLIQAESLAEQAIIFGKKSSLAVSNPEQLKRLVVEKQREAIKDNR